MTTKAQRLVEKYHDTIAEEVNVKKVSILSDDQQVTIQYIPLGNTLWEQFGKDTWRIIWSAKKGQAQLLDDKTLKVHDGEDEWILSEHQYELRYSWFDEDNQIVEDGAMVELDLTMTPELVQEWIAREVSRFLNQMRKDADFDVSDRITVGYQTWSEMLENVIKIHSSYLQEEALVASFTTDSLTWELESDFEYEWQIVHFVVKK